MFLKKVKEKNFYIFCNYIDANVFQGETGTSENPDDTTTGDDSADKGGEADGDEEAAEE